MRRRQTLYGEPAASACIPTANALPVLTPFARPRTLRGSPRRVLLSPPIRGLRLVRSLRRYRVATPTLAPNPGYRLPARSAAPFSLSPPSSPPRRMVLTPSEPRSVRADIIPGSERSATGVPRRPGVGAPSIPFGRAAEPARSAARASPGLLLAHAAATSAPTTPPDWGGRRPPTFVNPAMTPAGRLGGAGSCATRIFVDEPQGQSAIPAHLQRSLTLTRPVAPSPRSRKKKEAVCHPPGDWHTASGVVLSLILSGLYRCIAGLALTLLGEIGHRRCH